MNPNLAIDIGNTLAKLAIFSGNELLHIETHETVNADIINKLVNRFEVNRAIVSCVGELPSNFADFFSHKVEVLFFTASTPVPIKNCYKTPNSLGVDRLAAAVAANSLYPESNVLSVDCGTAITFDLVTSKAEYLGGSITLGVSTRFKALNSFTAKLPLLSIQDNYPLIGTSTSESILSGVLNGVVNEIDGYIDAVKAKYFPINIVFTGGDSFFFDKKLKNSIFVHPNLVLIGLNRILNYNE
jgi:type III pantothenate kinase